jgi:hypothetical protein
MARGKYMRNGVLVRFECTKCGGGTYGSRWLDANASNSESLFRHCNTPGCQTDFPLADDYKYFLVEGKLLPSREAYEEAVYTDNYDEASVQVATVVFST